MINMMILSKLENKESTVPTVFHFFQIPERHVLKESGNAQHFLGFNINVNGLKTLSEHLWRTHPGIRFINVPEEFKTIGKIGDICAGKFKDDDDVDNVYIRDIETRAGFKFAMISRTHSASNEREYSDSIWDCLPKNYGQQFTAQTWRNNAKNCCDDKVKNIIRTQILEKSKKTRWRTGKDHSKIGFGKKGDIICFGDLNHTRLKKTRGGSLFVFQNKKLARLFKKTFKYSVARKRKGK
uniref:Endonuclease/exonuclease/phosphatase domain-containing protein n=1 Tax=Panagrolaimus sp. ES5 TaxID=591445 RepID=A0AC34F3V7_9BILA